VITQVATGLFGVREETIQRVKIVEFKYAQGAKPGLGGHLLGDKVTPGVARMREAVVGYPLFSPFPFHSVYSVEDHKKHVDWIKAINPKALVSVKVSTPTDVDMVAVGSYYAGAHIIHLDGSYGGTGAAPDIAKKNIAMPIEYALPKVHRFLTEEGGAGQDYGHRQRRYSNTPRCGQSHCSGRRWGLYGNGGPGGPGVHQVPQL
jgi:glutamate synthase domain-containing protein 2